VSVAGIQGIVVTVSVHAATRLVIALVLASASGSEAYRFLNFFFTERRARRAFRHFNWLFRSQCRPRVLSAIGSFVNAWKMFCSSLRCSSMSRC